MRIVGETLDPPKDPSCQRALHALPCLLPFSRSQFLHVVTIRTLQGNAPLALPHLSVPSIDSLDWEALARAGFRGCVFDKDNTLSAPYAPALAPVLRPALERCRAAFGGRLVLFSNSAGLAQFDPDGAPRVQALHHVCVSLSLRALPSKACLVLFSKPTDLAHCNPDGATQG